VRAATRRFSPLEALVSGNVDGHLAATDAGCHARRERSETRRLSAEAARTSRTMASPSSRCDRAKLGAGKGTLRHRSRHCPRSSVSLVLAAHRRDPKLSREFATRRPAS